MCCDPSAGSHRRPSTVLHADCTTCDHSLVYPRCDMRMRVAAVRHYELTLVGDTIVQVVTLPTTIGDHSKVECDERKGSYEPVGRIVRKSTPEKFFTHPLL